MTAEIVAIGTEILFGDVVDSHSRRLAKLFLDYGVDHHRRTVVGDNLGRAAAAIRESLSRCDLLFTIGGLGPTPDDLTREAIGQAMDLPLETDHEYLCSLKEMMQRRGRVWIEAVGNMAMRPPGAIFFPNPVGAAPGILIEKGGKTVIALPGPKAEFEFILRESVVPWLKERSGSVIYAKTLRLVGLPESVVCSQIQGLLEGANPSVAPYAKPYEVHLRVAAKADSAEAAERLAAPAVEQIRDLFGKAVFGEDDEDLADVVVRMLLDSKLCVAVAESCTGGMLGSRLTSVPGASKAFLGGFITYTNERKARDLGVARVDLDKFGAVSEPIARQMAEGVRRVASVDFGIGITGIAGPDGGSDQKPVGLVYIGLASVRGTEVREERFAGDRELIRYRSTQVALDMARLEMLRG